MSEQFIHKKEICEILQWNKWRWERRHKELVEAGVIIKRRHGRPPRREWVGFESDIRAWIRAKAVKGEMI
jgi:hypothetical protein